MTAVDFWPSCGYTRLQRDARGWLAVTPAYLASLLDRPELALVPESGSPRFQCNK